MKAASALLLAFFLGKPEAMAQDAQIGTSRLKLRKKESTGFIPEPNFNRWFLEKPRNKSYNCWANPIRFYVWGDFASVFV